MCVVCAEEAAAEEEEPGIQNQKQEPHTKMWGKKHICIYTVFLVGGFKHFLFSII